MKTAYLHFGGAFTNLPNGPFTTTETDFIETAQPTIRTKTGYGGKIPMPYKVRNGSRFYRVYCANYGNSGTCYIEQHGKPVATVDFY